jgi:hypothetical protein
MPSDLMADFSATKLQTATDRHLCIKFTSGTVCNYITEFYISLYSYVHVAFDFMTESHIPFTMKHYLTDTVITGFDIELLE